jgi:hypothetical protein
MKKLKVTHNVETGNGFLYNYCWGMCTQQRQVKSEDTW